MPLKSSPDSNTRRVNVTRLIETRNVNSALPIPDGLPRALESAPAYALASRYGVTEYQIDYWREMLLRKADDLTGEVLPKAAAITPAQANRFQLQLSRWRRAHSNVFPTSIWLDERYRMTWADRWNFTAEKLGRPKIPDRGANWWWVEGRGLMQATDLLEGP